MIQSVYESKIERSYRFLAATLAFFADDAGENVYPRADRLAASLGVTESTVRHGLQALIKANVIAYDGFHGHTRRFRFNLGELRRYVPGTTTKRDPKARPSKPEPCYRQQGCTDSIGAGTLLPAAQN